MRVYRVLYMQVSRIYKYMNNPILHSHINELKTKKLKVTPVRLAILNLLESTDKPIDVETIKFYLIKNKIKADNATIFRIINIFTRRDIVRQISFLEGKFRYELTCRGEHHHLICQLCGRIEDISCDIVSLDRGIKKKRGFVVNFHSLEFFGICRECLNK